MIIIPNAHLRARQSKIVIFPADFIVFERANIVHELLSVDRGDVLCNMKVTMRNINGHQISYFGIMNIKVT